MTDITSHSKIERFQGFPGLNSVVNPYLSLCRHARIFNSHTHIGFMTDITSHSKIERFQGFPGLNSVVNPYLSLCRHALSWASKVHSITGQVILDFFFYFFLWSSYRLPISRRNMSSPPTSVLKGQTALPTDKVQQIGLLDAVNDKYGGVVVDMKEPMDSHIYVPLLRASISQWRQQGKKGVWIKLPIQQANLVEPTVKEGFRYHHAESNYLMLVYWIPDSPDTLPANASHIVGIGAFVMNNKREVLVVKEKHGYFEGKDAWKFPTGVVNQGEDICAAAIREVKEETGIDTEFMEILAFSQTHQQFLGKSDLFFVCMLQPLSFDITKQDSEIKAAQWIPIDEYVNQTYNREHKPFEYVAKICLTKSQSNYGGFSAVHTLTSSGKQPYLYFNGQDFKP